MIITFQDNEGKFNIDFPMTSQEIQFGDWCDFRALVKENDELELNEENAAKGVENIYAAVKLLVKGIDRVDYSDYKGDETISTIVGMFKYLCFIPEKLQFKDPRVKIVLNQQENLGRKLKRKLERFISNKKELPDGIWFKADDGNLYGIESKRIIKSIERSDMKTGEVIEALEMERRGKEEIEAIKDPGFMIEFNIGLSLAAILLRKPNEPLPVTKAERDIFIAKRKELFKNIPLSVIVNVRAFFLATLIAFTRATIADMPLSDLKTLITEME